MTSLASDPAAIVIAYRGFSGHPDYDRGIRDHVADAKRSDTTSRAYWTFRALTQAHLHLMSCRYNATCEQIDQAEQSALASLEQAHFSQAAIDYARSALRNRYDAREEAWSNRQVSA